MPYLASDWPCLILTDAEIDAAPDLSMGHRGRRIFEVGNQFVVNFGEVVNVAEGENILFIRE